MRDQLVLSAADDERIEISDPLPRAELASGSAPTTRC